MSFPKMVNDTVGFGNDALPVKAFNTALAKTTRLASDMEAKPMTARIGLIFEILILNLLLFYLNVWICGVRAHSTCASTEHAASDLVNIWQDFSPAPGFPTRRALASSPGRSSTGSPAR